MRRMLPARLAPAHVALVASLVASAITASRPAAAAELEFVAPEGFAVIASNGQPTPESLKSPVLSELARTPGLTLYAARLAANGTVMGTFQVLLKDRPYTFDATTLDRFATDITGEMKQGGMPPNVTNKSIITVAGEAAGRVVVVSQQRRMMFVGVPDGPKTALLLYAASENDFPTLYPDFERSVGATHHGSGTAPTAPAPTAPARSRTSPMPTSPTAVKPSDEASWLTLLPWAIGLAALAGVVLVRVRQPRDLKTPSTRPASRKRRR